MPNAWQDYAALIFAFYNRSGITLPAHKISKKKPLPFGSGLYKIK